MLIRKSRSSQYSAWPKELVKPWQSTRARNVAIGVLIEWGNTRNLDRRSHSTLQPSYGSIFVFPSIFLKSVGGRTDNFVAYHQDSYGID